MEIGGGPQPLVYINHSLTTHVNLHVLNKKDTYTATLVLRIFRALIVIIAYFNLKIK